MSSNYDTAAPVDDQTQADEGATNGLFGAVGAVVENLRSAGVANAPQQPPFESITHKIDPKTGETKTTVTGVSEATLKAFEENQRVAAQAKDIYSQIISQALQKKATLEAHPLVSAIGRITSQAASNYQLQGAGRPLVNAAGAFGQEYFKDTPESLLVRAAQARMQQFGITNTLENQAEDRQRLAVAERAAAAKEAENKIKDAHTTLVERDKWEGQMQTLAKQRLLPSPESYAQTARLQGMSDQEIATSYENLQSLQQQKVRDDALQSKLADDKSLAKEGRQFQKQMALFNATTSRMFSLESMRETAAAQKAKDAEVAKDIKAGKIGDATIGKITDMDAQLKQLDQLEKIIQKYPEYQGPLVGRVPDVAIGLGAKGGSEKAKEELKFRSDLLNSIQAIVKTHGGGARGYNPQEFNMVFRPLSAAPVKTQAQNLANIQAARQLIVNKLQSTAETLEATGKDVSKIPALKAFVSTPAPKQEPLPLDAVKALKEGVVTTFKNGEAWTLQNGRAVKVSQ